MGTEFLTTTFASIAKAITDMLTALGTAIAPIIAAVVGILAIFLAFRYWGKVISHVKKIFGKA